jgi:hypothetical protein
MIREGLLWYDPDPQKPLVKKLSEAAARYAEKYHIVPNLCQISPAHFEEIASLERPPLPVEYSRFIRPYYILVGVDSDQPVQSAAVEPAEAAPEAAVQPSVAQRRPSSGGARRKAAQRAPAPGARTQRRRHAGE